MSLAQVIFNISNDSDFASKWYNDPEAALAGKGLRLSREELVFLSKGLSHSRYSDGSTVKLSDLARAATSWR